MVLKNVLVVVAIVVLFVLVWLFLSELSSQEATEIATVTNFEECVAAGNPVMSARQNLDGGGSYPRQCITRDGGRFVEEVSLGMLVPPGFAVNGCAVAGCSGQLCVPAIEAGNIITTCEYRAEYACYREASCEPQSDGQCGWTQTAESQQCLANPPQLDENLQSI